MADSPLSSPAPADPGTPAADADAPATPAASQRAVAEIATLLASLIVGVVVMPCLIFLAGHLTLGDYARGGLFVFWRDVLAGLAHGSKPYWFVALVPYLLLWLARAGRRLLRA